MSFSKQELWPKLEHL